VKEPPGASRKRILLTFIKRLLREFGRDHCLVRASGLAFASLIALVPLSALLFSLFSAVGSFTELIDSLQSFLIRQLVPASQEEIMQYVRRFVENTRALGVVGLLFFLLTSIFLLNTIQSNFNAVWGTRSRGNSLRQLATYLSVLIVGSFLFSIGLNLSGVLRSLLADSVLSGLEKSMPVLLGLFPSLFIFAALFLMIRFIPAGRVRSRSALLGAAVGAVLWEIARRIFFLWVTYVIRLSLVYGSLAAVPIFLIWLYVAWAIVLAALEIAYVHQHGQKGWSGKRREEMSPAEAILFGMEIYLIIAGRFLNGEPPASPADLSRELAASEIDIRKVLDRLARRHLVLPVGRDRTAVVPSRSLDRITLRQLLEALIGGPPRDDPSQSRALGLLDDFLGEALSSTRELSIRELLEEEESEETDQAAAGDDRRTAGGEGPKLRRRLVELWSQLRPRGSRPPGRSPKRP
jgi:membrane protein